MNDRPDLRPAHKPGKRASIALAVAVHLLLAGLLFYGIRWQTKMQDVVEVELVQSVPAPAVKPEPAPEPKPEAKPEPKPEPKPLPKPEPKPLPPPPKPDIVVKEKPKPPKEEPKPKFDPTELLKAEEKHLDTRRLLEAEEKRLADQKAAQAASAQNKAKAEYADRIRAKIRGNIVLPPELKGNPVAEFRVTQLPSGEVIDVRKAKPSSHAGYDAAVERAILKSSPLPKPDNPGQFERQLHLTFCPQEPCQ